MRRVFLVSLAIMAVSAAAASLATAQVATGRASDDIVRDRLSLIAEEVCRRSTPVSFPEKFWLNTEAHWTVRPGVTRIVTKEVADEIMARLGFYREMTRDIIAAYSDGNYGKDMTIRNRLGTFSPGWRAVVSLYGLDWDDTCSDD